MRSDVLETSSHSKKTQFTLLESWSCLGSVAYAADVELIGKGYCECQQLLRRCLEKFREEKSMKSC